VTVPEEPFGPARPDIARRFRRVGSAILAQFVALFVPDRGVPPLVSMGRARLSIAIAIAAGLLSAAAISARVDLAPAVRAEMARGPGPGKGPGSGGPAAEPPGEDKTDRDIADEIDKRTAIVEVKAWLRAAVGMPAQIVGFAIALLLLGRFIGGKPSFQRALAASSIASLPLAVKSLIEAAATLRQARIGPDEVHQLVTSRLISAPHGDPLLARVAAASDLFSLWSVVLAGFGLAAAAGISRTRSFIAVTVAYLLFVLLMTSFFGAP
jgi:hypothetical protein